jgi:hypothetical protein
MVVVRVFVTTFFYLNKEFIEILGFIISICLIPVIGDVELFDGILTRGDVDDGPKENCEGGVPISKIR